MRHLSAQILALDRREVGGRRGEQRTKPLHPIEITREAVRHRHRHRAEQAHHLQVAIIEKVPARRAIDRFQDPLVGVAPPLGGKGGDAEEDTNKLSPLAHLRSEEHTSELQSLMRISYAVFCLKKQKHNKK